jgi:hypothetical protein
MQVKMAYLQDPVNGANPIMQRITPILQANIQEHSVMKYQEQMVGISEELMQQAPDQAGNPAVIEMAMAQAAQQVMNANQAMGQAQSPEQQLVALEQAKVELEKQKLQSDTVTDAAELEIKNKELEIKETAQIIEMLKASATANSREAQSQLNRESKEAIKEAELATRKEIEEAKIAADMLRKQMDDDKEMDMAALENLTQFASEQMKETNNDEER